MVKGSNKECGRKKLKNGVGRSVSLCGKPRPLRRPEQLPDFLGLEDSTWHKLTEYDTDFVMIDCDLAAPPGFGLESLQWPIGCKHSISHVVLPVQVDTVRGEAMLQRSHA